MWTCWRSVRVPGPRTTRAKDFPLCLRLRLRPGAARLLLGVPVRELIDRVVPLSDLWTYARELNHRLSELGADPRRLLAHLEPVLLARIATATGAELGRSELVCTATEALANGAEPRRERIRTLAQHLAVSERHLRELFLDYVGLSPKRFERIARLWGVLIEAAGPRPAWPISPRRPATTTSRTCPPSSARSWACRPRPLSPVAYHHRNAASPARRSPTEHLTRPR